MIVLNVLGFRPDSSRHRDHDSRLPGSCRSSRQLRAVSSLALRLRPIPGVRLSDVAPALASVMRHESHRAGFVGSASMSRVS